MRVAWVAGAVLLAGCASGTQRRAERATPGDALARLAQAEATAKSDASQLDRACFSELKRPAFLVNFAGPPP